MTGLTNANKDSMLSAIRTDFRVSGEGSDTPIKVVDDSFIDAEKWAIDKDRYSSQYSDYYFGYDSLHCWAAACANMLWISGWADGIVNPRTGVPFESEDDIFKYYNVSFSDEGSNTDRGIDWFFMGEFFVSGAANSAYTFDEHSGGLFRSFVSSNAQKQYDLVENPADIESMLRVASADPADRSVFEVSVGDLSAGELSSPLHSVTGIGLITDPDAADIADRYKAIVLIDSDNDAAPSAEEYAERAQIMSKFEGLEPFSAESNAVNAELIEYMESHKVERPDSYTVYRLRYTTDVNGTPFWEIVGYVNGATNAIYDIDELRYPSDTILAECTETEGTKDVNSEVDFTFDNLFTTSNTESLIDPNIPLADSAKKSDFAQGEPVNINYFLANRSNVILDDSYPGGNVVTVEWDVTRDSDGSIVASGSERQAFNNYKRLEFGAMLFLNKTGSGLAKWDPGAYTATVSFNKDRKFRESYYRNNHDGVVHFTVTEKTEPEAPDDPGTKPGDSDTKPGDKDTRPTDSDTGSGGSDSAQKETVKKAAKKAANTIKVSGKTIRLSAKKLRKKTCTIRRSKAISVSKARGAVTYQKVRVSRKNKNKQYVSASKYSKKIRVDKKTGRITVKKGLKKGTYRLKVRVKAAGTRKYKPAKKNVTVTIKVK